MSLIIRDPIHSYIEIAENIKAIIDSQSFQRLKYIKQLTIQHLYPSANHTRFEHSLGVMHLALLFYEKLKVALFENQLDNADPYQNYYYLKDHLLYASLLHDVGHAPFSHVGEKFFNKEDIIKEIEKEIISKGLTIPIDFLKEKDGNDSIAAHELMSCYVIVRKLLNKLVCSNNTPGKNIDIEFIFRIICGIEYKFDEKPIPKKIFTMNTIISIVNSKTIDVDQIDYLLRDNKMVDYIGPPVDINRLIMSVTVDKDSGGLMFTHKGISALQGLIECKDALYFWVFNHHTVVYTDHLYQRCFYLFDKLHEFSANAHEWLPIKYFFSCQAIADDCISDTDALSMINKAFKLAGQENTSLEDSNIKLLNQFKNREYLKPLWKTLYQYNDFLEKISERVIEKKGAKKESNNDKEEQRKKDEQEKLGIHIAIEENLKSLEEEILSDLGIDYGKLFIVIRENSFYGQKLDSLKILIDDSKKTLTDLLPIKDYEGKYRKTAFYVYCEEEMKDKVRIKLIEKLKKIVKDKQEEEQGPELPF